MRFRFHIVLALLILLIGIGGQLAYDFYLRPYVFARKVIVAKTEISLNKLITADDIAYMSFPNELVPDGSFTNPADIVGRSAVVTISQGSIITMHLIDDELYPGENQVIFPVPKESIFAVNGSLRKRDLVDISLYRSFDSSFSGSENPAFMTYSLTPLFEKVPVVFAMTEDNQNVKDTEKGDTNQRETSTGRVVNVELLLTKEQRNILIDKISEGYKLWLSRVSP